MLESLCLGDGPFRPNVAALIVPSAGDPDHILLGERPGLTGYWHWPQGGIEANEDPETALRREVLEETGIGELSILARLPRSYAYRFPQSVAAYFHPYIGQQQVFYLVCAHAGPNLAAATSPEFVRLQWKPLRQVPDLTVWFKSEIYRRVVQDAIDCLERLNPTA